VTAPHHPNGERALFHLAQRVAVYAGAVVAAGTALALINKTVIIGPMIRMQEPIAAQIVAARIAISEGRSRDSTMVARLDWLTDRQEALSDKIDALQRSAEMAAAFARVGARRTDQVNQTMQQVHEATSRIDNATDRIESKTDSIAGSVVWKRQKAPTTRR
jgi:hypothetical protein